MSSKYRSGIARSLRNGFETTGGLVTFYQVICWDSLAKAEARSLYRPFSTEARSTWAKQVLEAHYPGRSYEVIALHTAKAVDTEQMEVFEGWAVEEVGMVELADKYGRYAA